MLKTTQEVGTLRRCISGVKPVHCVLKCNSGSKPGHCVLKCNSGSMPLHCVLKSTPVVVGGYSMLRQCLSGSTTTVVVSGNATLRQ